MILNRVLNWLLFPATVAHEATHAAVWLPWTVDYERVDLAPGQSHASISVRLDDEIPGWALRLGYLAPVLVGTALALVAIALLVLGGGTFPEIDSVREAGYWAVLGAYWITFTAPSKEDLGLM